MLSFDRKFQSEPLPATPNLESAIAQSIKRAEKIVPIEVVQIKENPHMKPESDRYPSGVSLFDSGRDDGYGDCTFNLKSKFEVNKKVVNLELKLAGAPYVAGYEPSINTYLIGRGALEHCQNNREMFFYDVNHEAAHDEYLNLGSNKQRALNNLFIQDKTLNELLLKFATALYMDKAVSKDGSGKTIGDKYLQAHDMTDPGITAHISAGDQRGIKDTRSMEILINNQERDVLLGALITEFISFSVACERGEESFIKVANNHQKERNGEDPHFDVISAAHDYLKNNPELEKEFDKYDLYKNNNSEFLEAFLKETKRLERLLYM